MRTFLSQGLTPRDYYRLMTGAVVPRPIAWVSSIDASGGTNLAPFSFFTAVSTNPPLVLIAMQHRAAGKKDTLHNIEAAGEFVVNIADDSQLTAVTISARDYPPGHSEFVEAGLTPAASTLVRPPRVAEAPVAMECRLHEILAMGTSPVGIVIGEVLAWHFRADVADDKGRVDFSALRPLGRLAGDLYVACHDIRMQPREDARDGNG